MLDFVHIGDYKTATTWLQGDVFGPDARLDLLDTGKQGRQIYVALERVAWRGSQSDIETARTLLQSAAHKAHDQGVLAGLSRESLIGHDFVRLSDWRTAAKKLREMVGETRIICVFREQYRLLDSLYSTYVKNGGRLSARALFMPNDDPSAMLDRVAYDQIIESYKNIFGKDRCLFLLYQELRDDPKAFVGRIYDFIGLSAPTSLPLDRTPNQKLSHSGLTLQRLLNRAVPSICHLDEAASLSERLVGGLAALAAPGTVNIWRDRFAFGAPISAERLARGTTAVGGFRRLAEAVPGSKRRGKLFVPDDFVTATRDAIRATNERLEQEHGLPVRACGWTI